MVAIGGRDGGRREHEGTKARRGTKRLGDGEGAVWFGIGFRLSFGVLLGWGRMGDGLGVVFFWRFAMASDGASIPAVKLAEGVEGVVEAIAHRWSPRAFLEKGVEVEKLHVLFEAARWAASCFNEQPWRFLVARKEEPEAFARMLSILVPKNQDWAKGAAVLMLTVARRNFAHNNTVNRHALHDTGAALSQLAVQAASMGLQAHAMAGFDMDKARLVLKVPAEFEMGAAVALGYPGPSTMVAEAFRKAEEAPRARKPLSEIVFGAGFGEAAGI